MVEGHGGRLGGGQEEPGGKQVGVGDVADVGEVEEVEVVADLDLVLTGLVGVVEASESLDVSLAKDARGTNGGGQELVGFLTVGLDDQLLGVGL